MAAGDARGRVQCPATALLSAVTSGLSFVREPRRVRQRFEEELRSLVHAQSIVMRDGVPDATPLAPDVLTLDVPVAPQAGVRARLEVVLDPRRPVDEWTHHVLGAAAQVAALVLEIEYAAGRGVRLTLPDGAAPLIGSSEAIRLVRDRIEKVADTDFTVLIEGESGTGKELVARHIHELSHRRRGPFIAVNCAAIVESLLEAELFGIEDRTATGVRGRRGKFENAHLGTLFLDEVSDLSPAAQAKLLRAIQDLCVERVGGSASRRIDTRIIVATNRPLTSMVEQGRFRLDLFYRLHGVDIQVPPLRMRRDDVLELATYFLDRYRSVRPLALSTAAADALIAYHWPGNVRELERTIERAVALTASACIELDDLPPIILDGYSDVLMPAARAHHTMREWGSRYARLVLERCNNNKRQACRELGITYHTLQAYLRYDADEAKRAKAAVAIPIEGELPCEQV